MPDHAVADHRLFHTGRSQQPVEKAYPADGTPRQAPRRSPPTRHVGQILSRGILENLADRCDVFSIVFFKDDLPPPRRSWLRQPRIWGSAPSTLSWPSLLSAWSCWLSPAGTAPSMFTASRARASAVPADLQCARARCDPRNATAVAAEAERDPRPAVVRVSLPRQRPKRGGRDRHYMRPASRCIVNSRRFPPKSPISARAVPPSPKRLPDYRRRSASRPTSRVCLCRLRISSSLKDAAFSHVP